MNKPVFIKSDEILLVMCNDEIDNIAKSGPFYEEKDIIKFIDQTENAVQILRVEPTTHRCEDISEDIAEFYLREHEEQCLNGKIPHEFIEHSAAYSFFLEEIEQQRYEDEMFGTYEQQHRLTLWDVIPNYPHYTGRF
ncbi:hypothetical protein MCO_01065 [Bartonella sp. DB5-6]|uniref:hypothetical protein n=1 Tax=Bartonella TaxID=773 RepID=UPI00026E898A|nr:MULTISPECIES: hypothetical protein [Bartonella]EJF79499.1 hypothetical protein MCO_01065 [Bartonella sp. DB5-6]